MASTIAIDDLLEWAFRREQVETRRNPHTDALTVYWAVEALPEPYCALIKQQARRGEAPEWEVTMQTVVNLADLRQARARYNAWHKALHVLQQTLGGAVQTFRVTGPTAAATPWEGRSAGAIGRQTRAF